MQVVVHTSTSLLFRLNLAMSCGIAEGLYHVFAAMIMIIATRHSLANLRCSKLCFPPVLCPAPSRDSAYASADKLLMICMSNEQMRT
mmetsp:Transcript_32680/g.48394  ORF Transcript_32680/g.48394 Transcript_32680/m.48394 type:complete len:87 (-) Transcript_32680:60-320(-)